MTTPSTNGAPSAPIAEAVGLASATASPDSRFTDQANPYYTPRIVAAYRAYKEAEWGAPLPDETFKLGRGPYAHEPYYTLHAEGFRLFLAGAKYLESCLSTDGAGHGTASTTDGVRVPGMSE